jgi:uncharacterized protein YebE (UPF0316 family)
MIETTAAVPFMQSPLYTWLLLPLLIALARVLDVSIGTVRLIFLSRGFRGLVPLLGFFEVLIWVLAIGQIMQNLNNWACYLAYAAGFALGNWTGMMLEEKLAVGTVGIRIITRRDASELIAFLKSSKYSVTSVDAEGGRGKVHVIYSVIDRGSLPKVAAQIKRFNPRAFYSIEDIRFVSNGGSLTRNFRRRRNLRQMRRMLEKRK